MYLKVCSELVRLKVKAKYIQIEFWPVTLEEALRKIPADAEDVMHREKQRKDMYYLYCCCRLMKFFIDRKERKKENKR